MSYLTTFSPPLILAASKHLNKRLTNNINISDILSKADIQSPNMAFLRITILLVGAALIGISYAETCTSYPKGHTMKKYTGPVSHIISLIPIINNLFSPKNAQRKPSFEDSPRLERTSSSKRTMTFVKKLQVDLKQMETNQKQAT